MTWRHDGVLRPGFSRVGPREALQLHRGGGELRVLAGSIWLTRSRDTADYFLARGERFRVAAGHRAVIEAARPDQDTLVHWEPRSPGLRAWLAAAGQRLLASSMRARG